jgi:hypothetical protein
MPQRRGLSRRTRCGPSPEPGQPHPGVPGAPPADHSGDPVSPASRLRKSNLGSRWSEGWHWCAPSHRRSAHVLQSLTQPCHKSVTNGGVGGPKATHQAARSRALYAQNRTGAHHAAPLDCPGVKGSRVQISPARQHDDGLARLIRANSSGYWAILDKPECLVADWAHQREYAAPTSRMPGDPGRDSGSSPPGLDGQP